MTRVDFYIAEQRGRDEIACRLVEKGYAAGQQVHVRTADAAEAQRLDDLLWTFRQGSFIPHGRAGTPEADTAPVVVDHEGEPREPYQLLVNLGPDVPGCFSRFERVIEVVGAGQVDAGRERYRYYRDRGYPLSNTRV